jgi:hypothetical protein
MGQGREVKGNSLFPKRPNFNRRVKGGGRKKFFTNGVDNLELIG